MDEQNRTILNSVHNYSLLNKMKLLLFCCILKGFKFIKNIAANWIIILMGYLWKVYEDSQWEALIKIQLLYTMTI